MFKQNGLERYRPYREKFDPNLHSALFEVPDPMQKPGTIATVTKASPWALLHHRPWVCHSQKFGHQRWARAAVSTFESWLALPQWLPVQGLNMLGNIMHPASGTLQPGVAVQAGYKLHDRVLRPAEVGVVRAADGASAPGGLET